MFCSNDNTCADDRTIPVLFISIINRSQSYFFQISYLQILYYKGKKVDFVKPFFLLYYTRNLFYHCRVGKTVLNVNPLSSWRIVVVVLLVYKIKDPGSI